MTRKSDPYKTLIRKIIEGDAVSFDEFFNTYNKKVYAFALNNLKKREEAEDVVQEVFLSLWRERSKLKTVENLDAWLFSVCFNIIRKRFRQMAKERRDLLRFAEISLTDNEPVNTDAEYNELLEKATSIIGDLPGRQKEVLILSHREGLSNSEIAARMNIARKTVENHLARARRYIRKALIDERLLSLLFFYLFIK